MQYRYAYHTLGHGYLRICAVFWLPLPQLAHSWDTLHAHPTGIFCTIWTLPIFFGNGRFTLWETLLHENSYHKRSIVKICRFFSFPEEPSMKERCQALTQTDTSWITACWVIVTSVIASDPSGQDTSRGQNLKVVSCSNKRKALVPRSRKVDVPPPSIK